MLGQKLGQLESTLGMHGGKQVCLKVLAETFQYNKHNSAQAKPTTAVEDRHPTETNKNSNAVQRHC